MDRGWTSGTWKAESLQDHKRKEQYMGLRADQRTEHFYQALLFVIIKVYYYFHMAAIYIILWNDVHKQLLYVLDAFDD